MVNPLTTSQRRVEHFSFVMTVHPNQADPKFKYIHMTCRACVQIPLYENWTDNIIENEILDTPHDILVHLTALKNGRNQALSSSRKMGKTYFQSAA